MSSYRRYITEIALKRSPDYVLITIVITGATWYLAAARRTIERKNTGLA